MRLSVYCKTSLCVLSGRFIQYQILQSLRTDSSRALGRMAESAEIKTESTAQSKKTAIILGYTGETGKLILQQLVKTSPFKKVFLIGRRQTELPAGCGSDFEQKVVDYDNLEQYADTFRGSDVCFCCLGTTKGKSGREGFIKVDKDYVLQAAELLKEGGCAHFQLMSTNSANAKSSFLYLRIKGEVEEALKEMNFERLSIFRPATLLVDRQERRFGEGLIRCCLTPLSKCFPTALSIPGVSVAKAMIKDAIMPSDKKVEVFENKTIFQMGQD